MCTEMLFGGITLCRPSVWIDIVSLIILKEHSIGTKHSTYRNMNKAIKCGQENYECLFNKYFKVSDARYTNV